ncbi:MAG: sigma-70 family RNA polymerase sigma factor [Myxococcota bacterium]
MDSGDLEAQDLAAFLAPFDAAQRTALGAEDELRPRLLELTRIAQADPPGFVRFLGERIARSERALEALTEVDGAAMGLVYRCLRGEPPALAEFDATVLEPASRGLLRMGASAAEIADIRQIVREKMLVGTHGRGPRISEYSGRGALGSWVRVTLVRELLTERRKHQREVAIDDEALFDAATGDPDPETEHLKTYYRAEFRRGFAVALAKLSGRDRNLLRYHFLESLSIDEIGLIYGVHRATAARWLVRVRETLEQSTLEAMMSALSVSRPEMESILRLIKSNLDASIATFLESSEDRDRE